MFALYTHINPTSNHRYISNNCLVHMYVYKHGYIKQKNNINLNQLSYLHGFLIKNETEIETHCSLQYMYKKIVLPSVSVTGATGRRFAHYLCVHLRHSGTLLRSVQPLLSFNIFMRRIRLCICVCASMFQCSNSEKCDSSLGVWGLTQIQVSCLNA